MSCYWGLRISRKDSPLFLLLLLLLLLIYRKTIVDRSIERGKGVGSCSAKEVINRICLDVDWGWRKLFFQAAQSF